MIRSALLTILLLATAPAFANDKPWPCSQCTNGWVDAMTGKCPPRPQCKPKHKKVDYVTYCAPAIASLSSIKCIRVLRNGPE